MRTKKGVKKLDEQYENTQFQLIHESVQLSDSGMILVVPVQIEL